MADIKVRLITNEEGRRPRLTVRPGAADGRRFFRVMTHDEGLALTADNLPKIGDSWDSGLYAGVRVVEINSEYEKGTDDTSRSSLGSTVCEVVYSTPSGGGSLRPVSTDPFTVYEPGIVTVQQMFDQRPGDDGQSPGFTTKAIANGQGAPRDVGVLVANVVTFTQTNIPMQRLLRLQADQNVNDETLILPQVRSGGNIFGYQPGQVRYHTFREEPTIINGQTWTQLTHVLKLAPDHWARWYEEGPDGQRRTTNLPGGETTLAPALAAVQYLPADLSGLWPQ